MTDSSRLQARRLALNACNPCRQRKTRCDETRPQCSRCGRLGLACTYEETVASRKDLSMNELNGTLKRMEDKLDSLLEMRSPQPSPGRPESLEREHRTPNMSADGMVSIATRPSSQHDSDRVPASQRHSTAPQHLLSWPCSPLRLHPSELQYPLKLETKQTSLPETVAPPSCLRSDTDEAQGDLTQWLTRISISQLRFLAKLYFSHFHPSYMILDETHFYQHCLNRILQNGFDQSIDSCIVLLVLGLGSVAAYHMGNPEWAPSGSGAPSAGLSFFNAAKDIFHHIEAVEWSSVQCLLLMASFYSCKLRVMDSWRATHNACTTILILLRLEATLDAQHCQLYWIAYLQESQILAEFDLPPSGLAASAGDVPLPVVLGPGTGPHHWECHFSLLAVIALRRLLNRIHSHIYSFENTSGLSTVVDPHETTSPSSGSDAVPSPPESLISELDRQLEEWRACLPPPLQFPPYVLSQREQLPTGEPRSTSERLKGNLMARYFAAKSILHRPFLYRLLHSLHVSTLSQRDMTGAQIAIDSAFQSFLQNRIMHEPLPILVHPMNAWRSIFALEIQTKFVLRAGEAFHFALPDNWELASQVREKIALDASSMSPCVARDCEILERL